MEKKNRNHVGWTNWELVTWKRPRWNRYFFFVALWWWTFIILGFILIVVLVPITKSSQYRERPTIPAQLATRYQSHVDMVKLLFKVPANWFFLLLLIVSKECGWSPFRGHILKTKLIIPWCLICFTIVYHYPFHP